MVNFPETTKLEFGRNPDTGELNVWLDYAQLHVTKKYLAIKIIGKEVITN